jgi:hypothetical protein
MFQLPSSPAGRNNERGSGLRGGSGIGSPFALRNGVVGSGLEQVMATNDDATLTKLSAVERGYYEDPFIKLFAGLGGGSGFGRNTRQPPLMNRGYYSRVRIIRGLLLDFLNAGGRQVVNLGAGYDTTFFYLKSKNLLPMKEKEEIVFYEFDLPQVVRNKTQLISKHEPLMSLLEGPYQATG